ncbi:exonuclease domain-containing protein [Marinobacteraceae bacterium S3BR75-40.1]
MHDSIYAFIDLETTGGNAGWDRIIEIGLRLWRDGEVIDEWQTLVNPETRISPFIEHFTGITNAMVADAPTFEEVADTLRDKLDNCIFVAHNARFDYGFVKGEFRRLGEPFAARVLCTVKLSRALYPQYRRHSMDTLIERHGLQAGERHRAMGDVESMFQFFQKARAEHGDEAFYAQVKRLLKRPSIPSHLPPDLLKSLPERPGVYRFYGENDVLLYVGKSTNIRQRVASHFSGDHQTGKGVRLSQSLRHVDWTETAGELGALLLELKQIKTLNPLYNRRSRAAKNLVSFRLVPNQEGYLTAELAWDIDPNRLGEYYGLFRSKSQALKALSGIAQKNELCNKLLGIDNAGFGPCFQRHLGRCKGACEGEEDVTRYNLRMQIAFHTLRLQTWPWKGMVGVVERNAETGRTDIHVIYNWAHITTVQSESELHDLTLGGGQVAFDLDSYKLIVKALLGPERKLEVMEMGEVALPELVMETE